MKNNKPIIIDCGELGKIKITKEMIDEMRLGRNILQLGDGRLKNPLMRKIYKDEDCITPSELWNKVIDDDRGWFSNRMLGMKEKIMNSLEYDIKSNLIMDIHTNTKHLRINKEFYKDDGIPND